MLLRSITYQKQKDHQYPENLPIFQKFRKLEFHNPVTIFVGENGTGKTTLIEAIANEANLIRIGSEKHCWDELNCMSLTWSNRNRKGFYLSADDFNRFVRKAAQMKQDAQDALDEIEQAYQHRTQYAKSLASMPHNRTLHDLHHLYQDGLEYRSHGERFLDFFQSRFKPKGLYLLDEPEVPLSPMRQLTLISMMKEMVQQGAQFIIATHSPILMAFPDAEIISFDTLPPEVTPYDELEHVQITKQFLNSPERYLKHL